MQTVSQQLQNRVAQALEKTADELKADSALLTPALSRVVPTANAQFGDYQWNGALGLAKQWKTNPRALAQTLINHLDVSGISQTPEIAGPGFVNFRLEHDFLENALRELLSDARCGVPQSAETRTVVIDYPSPNVAKPLHVGHIRTMFIGDAIARILRFAGHKVIADNHVGDWGTPIGKVIVGWKTELDRDNFEKSPLEEMGRLYKNVDAQGKENPQILERARQEIAALHEGDEENLAIWKELRAASEPQLEAMYERLDIHVDVTLGESFYHERLAALVNGLTKRGIAKTSESAIVIAFDEAGLQDRAMLIRKSDGSFLYATTDLATIDYRLETWQPDEIIYVVDARQSLHFRQLFAAVRLWGRDEVKLEHVEFGKILGEDGTPIKTRDGEPPRLDALLDEAQRRALEIVREKNPDLSAEQQNEVARVVGIGALKYADLSQNRSSDYTFSWDKLLAMQGNSAPYLLFAYVRVRSIFRRAGLSDAEVARLADASTCQLEHANELALCKYLLRFHEAVETALQDYRPNAISDYLFALAQEFSAFIENCRVLDAPEPHKTTRLMLCAQTARVLKQGLNLLGIETIEQM